MADFYDQLAPFYHLVFADWDASMQQQGGQLAAIIDAHWPVARRVLDVSCGIGTQAIALTQRNYIVTASDRSEGAVQRARREALQRQLPIAFSVCDMRLAHEHHGGDFDLVLSADNSLAHLLTDEDILTALRQMHDCVKPGGGCLVTMRDYDTQARGRGLVVPYPVRELHGKRYILFQRWDFDGAYCEVKFYVIEEVPETREATIHVMRSHAYAVSTGRVCELMREAGFADVQRLDGVFYQPVLIGTRK